VLCFYFFRTFAPIVHIKFCGFLLAGVQEYLLPQGAEYPSYATDFSKSKCAFFACFLKKTKRICAKFFFSV